MSRFIPKKGTGSYLSPRNIKRQEEHFKNKIEKKFGQFLDIPTKEEMKAYIESIPKPKPTWLTVNQEEKQTN